MIGGTALWANNLLLSPPTAYRKPTANENRIHRKNMPSSVIVNSYQNRNYDHLAFLLGSRFGDLVRLQGLYEPRPESSFRSSWSPFGYKSLHHMGLQQRSASASLTFGRTQRLPRSGATRKRTEGSPTSLRIDPTQLADGSIGGRQPFERASRP
jgi:hypothetical protein